MKRPTSYLYACTYNGWNDSFLFPYDGYARQGKYENSYGCKEIEFFRKLEAGGFLTITYAKCAPGYYDVNVNINSKLEPYLVKNDFCGWIDLKLGALSDIEVKLIKDNSATSKTVKYTEIFKPNAVGELYLQVGTISRNKTFKRSRSADFIKTDEGWRIE